MLQYLSEIEPDLPGWLRPTFRGALFSFGITTGTIGKLFVLLLVATLVYMAGVAQGALLFVQLFGVTIAAGAVGGTMHGLLWRAEDWGRIGIWLRWVFSILAYITTFGILAPAGLAVSRPAGIVWNRDGRRCGLPRSRCAVATIPGWPRL